MNLQSGFFRKTCFFSLSYGVRSNSVGNPSVSDLFSPFLLLSEGIIGSMGENFPYVMDHTVEQPLDVNLNPPPEGQVSL